MHEHHLPVQRACRVVRLSRAAFYRPPMPTTRRDAAVIAALTDVVARYPRWGFWKLFARMRVDGRRWNHKHVHRVYCALRLNLPRRTTRRVPRRVRQPLSAPPRQNQTWALDFMTETLYDGRRVRLLTMMDEGNREGLEVVMGLSVPSRRVTRALDELVAVHGCPSAIRVDNGLPWKSRRQSFSNLTAASGDDHNAAPSGFHRGGSHADHSHTGSREEPRALTRLHRALQSRWKVRALSTRSHAPRRPLAKGSSRLVSSLPGSGDTRCRS